MTRATVEFPFRLFPGAIRNPQVLSSWNTRCITHPASYWGREMDYGVIAGGRYKDFVQQKQKWLWLEFLPAYATKIQPGGISVGTIWKEHELQNLSRFVNFIS